MTTPKEPSTRIIEASLRRSRIRHLKAELNKLSPSGRGPGRRYWVKRAEVLTAVQKVQKALVLLKDQGSLTKRTLALMLLEEVASTSWTVKSK